MTASNCKGGWEVESNAVPRRKRKSFPSQLCISDQGMCTKKRRGRGERWVEDRELPPSFTMSCKNLIFPHWSCIYRNCIAANIGSFAFRDFWEIKIIFNTDDLVYRNFMANRGLTLCKNTVVQSVRHVFFHSFPEQNQRQEPKLQHEKFLVKRKFERERENMWMFEQNSSVGLRNPLCRSLVNNVGSHHSLKSICQPIGTQVFRGCSFLKHEVLNPDTLTSGRVWSKC